MPTSQTKLGWRGEAAARAWLERQGWIFVERNFRTRYGEIDLIMRDRETLVFVEVKTRRSRTFGAPEESITDQKLERLQAAAEAYLAKHPWLGPMRFDLVILEQDNGNGSRRHIRSIG